MLDIDYYIWSKAYIVSHQDSRHIYFGIANG